MKALFLLAAINAPLVSDLPANVTTPCQVTVYPEVLTAQVECIMPVSFDEAMRLVNNIAASHRLGPYLPYLGIPKEGEGRKYSTGWQFLLVAD